MFGKKTNKIKAEKYFLPQIICKGVKKLGEGNFRETHESSKRLIKYSEISK